MYNCDWKGDCIVAPENLLLSNVIRLIFIAIGFIGSTIATCAKKDETVLRRDSSGRIVLVKCALISSLDNFFPLFGWYKDGLFLSRENTLLVTGRNMEFLHKINTRTWSYICIMQWMSKHVSLRIHSKSSIFGSFGSFSWFFSMI
jgi:hypothetical protein